ncbi:flagellar filament capping protein FliD [Marinomonas colpomeniae]|uniref:Flagellar hook-associated protein 2 n=1 Tax=Marinomonas colpomeniae TaxID=2774408 RepID=A0ABR8NVX3_9GAMM|nr:flagellar filament capping protein FliD [Marinomonas colpomeniae]MBD5769750.1 flagellar filament capping protein FliD [Marinomonas colpomeniae]
MSIGSLGIGSGMDLESLVKEMVSAQKDAKVRLYQTQINEYEAELSALGQVGSAIDNFKYSVQSLNDEDLFTGRDAKIAQKEGEEVMSINTDNTASNGSYSIDINQIAKGSRVMSAPGVFSSADDVITKKNDTLIFKAGDNEFSIDVTAGTTLSELRNLINTSEDNFGVSANLVDDGSGNLFFTATSSIEGAGNTLRIINSSPIDKTDELLDDKEETPIEDTLAVDESEEIDELDLAGDDVDFANDGPIPEDDVKEAAEAAVKETIADEDDSSDEENESAAFNGSATGLNSVSTEGMFAGLYTPLGEQARDAVITVDGIQIRNETNTFDNAVAGLSIEALAVTDKTTKVDVSFDQKTVQETIKEFIGSYNDLLNTFQQSTGKNSALSGNSMIRNLQSSLSSQLMAGRSDTGVFTSVFDLGVKMDNKGVLSFDSAKFDNAMKKGYSDVVSLMTGEKGLAQSLEDLLDNYTGSSGMTNSLRDSVSGSIDSTELRLEAYEDRMARYEESLRDKFTGLDSRLANMNAQGNYLNTVLSRL